MGRFISRANVTVELLNEFCCSVHGFLCKSCPKRFTKKQSRSMFERQFNPAPNSAFDGSFGVDSEDIMNSPHIDAGSLCVFKPIHSASWKTHADIHFINF